MFICTFICVNDNEVQLSYLNGITKHLIGIEPRLAGLMI